MAISALVSLVWTIPPSCRVFIAANRAGWDAGLDKSRARSIDPLAATGIACRYVGENAREAHDQGCIRDRRLSAGAAAAARGRRHELLVGRCRGRHPLSAGAAIRRAHAGGDPGG